MYICAEFLTLTAQIGVPRQSPRIVTLAYQLAQSTQMMLAGFRFTLGEVLSASVLKSEESFENIVCTYMYSTCTSTVKETQILATT